ncbi:MAG: DUF4340 domain-containing protein [Myxococcota bacterium]|nr:DUF4340 domain-containing protein [Myxococcota bacterium]
MSRRTTIVLGVVAIAMAAFIVLFESGMLSTGELEARRGRVIQSFVRPRVTDVEVRRDEERVVLHRDREEDLDSFEIGHWSITEPIESDADQDAVDQLLSSLEWLEARRTLSGITDEDRERFGLDEPRASVRFTVADREVTVTVGGDDPRGEGVYAAVSDRPGEAFVVGRDFVEALEHGVDHFRRKELFASFRSTDASSAELRNAESHIRLERADGRWWLREPDDALARTSAVESLLGAMHELRATRFVTQSADDLATYGLAEPTRELVVEREGGEADASADRSPLRLRVGGACPDHDGELTAIAGDDGPIVCVEAGAVEVLGSDAERLRENRLLTLRDDELERATVHVGESELELRRQDASWQIVRGDADRLHSPTRPGDADSIADWMRLLRAQEATAYEPASAEALRARGLAAPRATLTFHRSDADRGETITVGAVDAEGVWVRRGEEARIARFPLAAEELLTPAAIRFRDRRLVRDSETSAQRLRIVRDGVEEILERSGAEWRVTVPLELPADRVIARDVVRSLASLTALRFAADRARPEHGLDRPRIVLTARFEGPLPSAEDEAAEDEHEHEHEEAEAEADPEPREIVLRIGDATDGGSFARVDDDPAVFVVPSSLVDDLDGPLASRDLLATESSALESLAIVRGGERVELRREGDGWTAGSGAADELRTTLVLDRLASMRALGTTTYGEPPADAGFASPTLVLEIQRRSGAPERYELQVGAPGQGGDDGWYHARRTDLPVGFRLGTPVVRAFLDYQP